MVCKLAQTHFAELDALHAHMVVLLVYSWDPHVQRNIFDLRRFVVNA